MQQAPPTPKGFRDIQPPYAKKRREIINIIAPVLEENGFVLLETPTLEFASTLTGKYGEEEKLIYKFKDRGDRELALRYDLTVPLARFIANNQNLLKPTFSRYQIGQVFRGENPQHGRYREFTQFDFDTVGPSGVEEDAKIIACAIESIRPLGLKNAIMTINDRETLSIFVVNEIRIIDKLYKVGIDGVEKELEEKQVSKEKIQKIKNFVKNKPNPPEKLQKIFDALNNKFGLKEDADYSFDHTLARGLDYYTGSIFELKPDNNPTSLSIGAGGRYDNLVGMFAGKDIPAVGFSFGLDRIVDSLLND
ncbi:MAG: histidine--tRNA ligase [Patescibacteria group bacterium]|mgnify:CR=1 FL=1